MNLFGKFALKIQSIFDGFDPLSFGPPLQFEQPDLHPVFIVGAPRSGSTLLYQLLLKHTRLTYISNLMSLLPNRMVRISKHTHRLHKFGKLKESSLGYLPGLFSPSEAGAIQRRWFAIESPAANPDQVRNTIILLTRITSSPFISKNLLNSLRMINIHQILPEARYLFVRRDPLFNAHSLLLSRKKVHGTENRWWSTKPIGYGKTTQSSPEYQVVWQVLEIEKTVTRFLDNYSPPHMEISYENLCHNPQGTIENIVKQFHLEIKQDVAFDRLIARNSIAIPQDSWEKITYWYNKLSDRPHQIQHPLEKGGC